MKRKALLACVALAGLGHSLALGDLINGGFETGDLSGLTAGGSHGGCGVLSDEQPISGHQSDQHGPKRT